MFLNKSAIRLSLLAGSSLAAMLASSPAQAANECGNPSVNGSAPDVLVCPPGSYPAGIDYSTTSDGDLTVILRDRVNTGTSNTAGTGGIRMYGDTDENMSLVREDTVGVIGDPRIINTAGRGIDVTTQGDGNVLVNLTDGDPTAGEPTTPAASAPAPLRLTGGSDAIRAQATGTGSVNVTIAETGTASGANHPRAIITAGANAGSNGSGVVARSTSGDITVDTRGATFTINQTNGGSAIDAVSTSGNLNISTGNAAGRLRGILAQTGGSGTITLTTTGSVSANGTTGVAGIETVAGTGLTTINITSSVTGAGAGPAIRATSASTSATAAVNIQNTGGTVIGAVNFSGVTAGGVTFNSTGATSSSGRWQASGASVFSGQQDTLTMAGAGQNTIAAGSSINFAGGNDTWTLSSGLAATGASIDFGAGDDVFNLSGTLSANGLVTVDGLEAFNHSGVIYLGGTSGTATDGAADDVLRISSGTFTGSGPARVVMDVILGGAAQAGCATIVSADCLDLRGASTAGVTVLTLIQGGVPTGRFDPVGITLVDVEGGTSAAGHFVLDPNSSGYFEDPAFGPGIQRLGLFYYALAYDPASQRHALFGVPRSETFEYAMLGSAAHSIWHMTADTVTDRQTDLRAGTEGGVVWLRTSGEYSKRDVSTPFEFLAETFAIDNSYKLYAGTIMGGMDLLSGESGDLEYVLGVQIGYVGSAFDLDASASSGRITGATGGLYGSVWNGRYFIDTTFNANLLTLDYDSPGLGNQTNTYLNSLGARLEAGRRFALSEHLFVDPLATVAFVRTGFEEISLTGGEVQPDDTESLRGALGLRVGGDTRGQSVNLSYFVAGRLWEEFKGEGGGLIRNPGDTLGYAGDFGGSFTEAEAGLSLYNDANTLSGFLTTGVKSGDAYSAVSLSLGVNMRW